ncbi:maleylpyruvate isomerase family mycothiol-dependent enzyme [Streptacidiphilus monticola]|uniref:Sterol carrier family protein n=1 Tax=Streptacidiphilus monticola TaxID=2161674 RepID=A0ABW1G6R1_9ACTN
MPPTSRSSSRGAKKPRRYDPARTRAALAAQTEALRSAVHSLGTDDLDRPTRLGSWTVCELVAHLGTVYDSITHAVGELPPAGDPLTPSQWIAATRTAAPAIERYAHEIAATADLDRSADAALALLQDELTRNPDLVVPIRFGPMLLDDYLLTRLIETVVHADDLADAVGIDAFPHDRHALATVTRLLADALAERAPGGSVELRVPPFAVVQCVEGPKHTRGTPPNVVETDPLTWIRLATGREQWEHAVDVAQLTASGERSDLSPLLPVMG